MSRHKPLGGQKRLKSPWGVFKPLLEVKLQDSQRPGQRSQQQLQKMGHAAVTREETAAADVLREAGGGTLETA